MRGTGVFLYHPHKLMITIPYDLIMTFLLIISSVLVAFLAWHLQCIYSNYQQARRIGLLIIINPVNVLNPIWILTQNWLIPFLNWLLGGFVKYSTFSLGFVDRHFLHDR